MSFQRLLRLASLATLLGAAAACGDDSSGPRMPAAGTHRSTFAGDYAGSHAGAAVFGADGDDETQYFGVILGADEDDVANIVILREGSTRLEVGEHDVANTVDGSDVEADEVEFLVGIGNPGSSTVGFLDGRSGTLRITRSDAAGLAGTFSIVAEGLIERDGETAEPAEVQISGAFSAIPAEAASGLRIQATRLEVKRLSR
jgi:hypothetical protein